MQVPGVELSQFRYEAPYVLAIGVLLRRVLDRVALHRGEPLGDAAQALMLPHHAVDGPDRLLLRDIYGLH